MENVRNCIYDVNEKPKKLLHWIIYPLQILIACFVATVLISVITNTPTSAVLVGAGLGTIVHAFITKFKSPMMISSSGAMAPAVIGALTLGNAVSQNFTAVFVGSLCFLVVYIILSLTVKFAGQKTLDKLFPPRVIGPVVITLGASLAAFIPTYTNALGVSSNWEVYIAFAVMFVIAITSHYGKGFVGSIAFLVGIAFGYAVATVLTLTSTCPLIDFSVFKNTGFFQMPDFAFFHIDFVNDFSWDMLPSIITLFLPVAIACSLENLSDNKALSAVIGHDLYKDPGMARIYIGNGVATVVGCFVAGMPLTSYGEGISTNAISRVYSVYVTLVAAVLMIFLGFIAPFQALLSSISSSIFGGAALLLYGMIGGSGLRMLIESQVDLTNNKNMLVVAGSLTAGLSGVVLKFGELSFTGVALALIAGVVLNIILKEKETVE